MRVCFQFQWCWRNRSHCPLSDEAVTMRSKRQRECRVFARRVQAGVHTIAPPPPSRHFHLSLIVLGYCPFNLDLIQYQNEIDWLSPVTAFGDDYWRCWSHLCTMICKQDRHIWLKGIYYYFWSISKGNKMAEMNGTYSITFSVING